MMFFLALGFIYFITQTKKEENVTEATEYKKPYVLVFGSLIVLALISIYWGNIRPLQASHYIVKAKQVPIAESIGLFEKGIRLSPMAASEGAEQFSSYTSENIFVEGVDVDALYRAFLGSQAELKEVIKNNPGNFRLYLALGKNYDNFYNLTKDQEALSSAREILEKAKELSPKNQQVYWELAQNELYWGNKEACLAYMQESITLEPGYHFSYWYLSLVYRVLGDTELAWENMQIARDKGYDWDNSLSDLIKVISVNQALGNDEDLIPLYDAALRLDPRNAKLAGGMALSYANLGYYEKASEMASLAAKLDPTLKDDLQPIIDLWQ
jgi:tetratricopeptide (TPR) repeat protein